jgi:hypothetical protein
LQVNTDESIGERMKGQISLLIIISLAVVGCTRPAAASSEGGNPLDTGEVARTSNIDWKAVEAALGRTSVVQNGDVHRFSMPRTDLTVTVDGIRLKPAFALGSWVSFKAVSDGAIAMGDLVLLDTEVAAVMTRLQESGIEQTAIHHHVLRESPRVVYMHVHAHGDPVRIASGLKAALALTGTPASSAPSPAVVGDAPLDTVAIARTLGVTGRMSGGVYQVSVPRAETVRDSGREIPAVMGLATAINFQPISEGKAAITGDFVMTAAEINPVIRALRKNGIEVTSLHNHLLFDEPRLFFMHFWANDDALRLARGLREALDLTNSARSP